MSSSIRRMGIAGAHIALLATLLMPVVALAADPVTPATPATTQEADDTANAQQGTFVPLTQLPGIQDVANSATLPAFLNQLYKILIGAGAVIAVVMIMYAGVEIMMSQGSVSSNEKAKSRISNSILGLVLLLSPTIVFSIINPDILKLNLNTSGLEVPLNHVDTTPLGGAAAANNCSVYTSKKEVRAGSNQTASDLSCEAGLEKAPDNCCVLNYTGSICCGKRGATQYRIAYSATQTPLSGGGASCTTYQGPFFYASQTECKAALDTFSKTSASNYKYTNFKALSSCEVATSNDFPFPTDPKACRAPATSSQYIFAYYYVDPNGLGAGKKCWTSDFTLYNDAASCTAEKGAEDDTMKTLASQGKSSNYTVVKSCEVHDGKNYVVAPPSEIANLPKC